MDPYANMGCVLKVNAKCEACKMKVLEVVGSICGTYNISIDGERGLADISGQVDPNMLLRALAQSGQHAELVRVKLQHPASRPPVARRRHAMPMPMRMPMPMPMPMRRSDYSHDEYYYYGHDAYGAKPYGTQHHQPNYPIHDPYWYERKPVQPSPLPSMHYPYHSSTCSLVRNGCCHHGHTY